MRIAETTALVCYRTEPALKLMRRDAVTSGIGNARLSSFEPMLCRTALGKLPLVLTSLANRTIDENLEAPCQGDPDQSTEAVPNSLYQLPLARP